MENSSFFELGYSLWVTFVCILIIIVLGYFIKGYLKSEKEREYLEEENQRLLTALENANDKVFGLDAEIETKSLKIAKDLETIEAMKVVLNTQNLLIANHKVESHE